MQTRVQVGTKICRKSITRFPKFARSTAFVFGVECVAIGIATASRLHGMFSLP